MSIVVTLRTEFFRFLTNKIIIANSILQIMERNNKDKTVLLHHVQQSICTTRLPYRQGRKLTAVKVYSITKESNHLLIFGVPSINLRQETKSLFIKFGKLLQFNISNHAAEPFTNTYHAQFERIQSARIAKRMLDTKNFYGGLLHVCYAPELEDVDETRQKLTQRQQNVTFRLRNLEKEVITEKKPSIHQELKQEQSRKVNMGEFNTIRVATNSVKKSLKVVCKKRKIQGKVEEKEYTPCFIEQKHENNNLSVFNSNAQIIGPPMFNQLDVISSNGTKAGSGSKLQAIDIVDCTSVETAVVTNINEHLNYNNFGNEIVKKVPLKPENKIKFYMKKKILVYFDVLF